MILLLRLMESNVLAYQNTNSNATQVEAIQELMDLGKLSEPCPLFKLLLQVCHAHSHDRHHISAQQHAGHDAAVLWNALLPM